MAEKFTLTGGARIGMANATFPFADLYVDKEILKINASVIGNLVFRPKDIISIQPYSSISKGIKIVHNVEKYSSEVIFWTFKKPGFVIEEIRKTGFFENTDYNSDNDLLIHERQKQGGFPIRKSAAIFLIVMWNALFLSDIIPFFIHKNNSGSPFGMGMTAAIGLILISAILILVSEKFRKLILKEGRDLYDVKKFIYFIIIITGFMFLSFSMSNILK